MAKRALAPIEGGRIRLRPLAESDLPMTLAWRNQDGIRQWFLQSDVITPERHQAWWTEYSEKDDDFLFMIEERETFCGPVGQVGVYHIDWQARTAEFGRLLIGEPAGRGIGLARAATELLLRECFDAWGLQDVRLEVMAANTTALELYRRCGFEATATRSGVVCMRARRPHTRIGDR
jgi:RimJ/RimL family protein N-acetyltransferase